MSLARVAAAVRERHVSCRDVIAAHLDRIAAVNSAVNAVTRVLADDALAAAETADRAIAAGRVPRPLEGVPFTVKENIDLAGSPTTMGVLDLKDDLPLADAPHVAQLKAAGAIPIARTNLPDFAMRWHTDNALYGLTLNPWDPTITAGGSSGGDAVALATGMAPLGLGNDIAGSVRWPSQCCGTAALKPSAGRIARARMKANPAAASITAQMFAVQGPMTRHASDLRLALAHTSGYSPHDPWWVPAPLEGPPPPHPIRAAAIVDPGGLGTAPEVAEGVRAAAGALAAAGYAVEECEPPHTERAFQVYYQLLGPLGASYPDERLSETFLAYRRAFHGAYDDIYGPPSADGWVERAAIAREWSQFQHEVPIIVAPVSTIPAFPVGFDAAGRAEAVEWLVASRMIVVVNFLGLPAVAVPTGIVNGVPQGVQVIAPRYREDLAITAAETIEARLGSRVPIDPRPARTTN
jgi:amidase